MSIATTDPIADMLTRIRNAISVNKTEVNLPHSKVKESIAKLLKDNHYIVEFKTTDLSIGKNLNIKLSDEPGANTITEIQRISTPGRRHYASAEKIPVVKRGRGLVIVSTNKGMLTGDDAKKYNVGGELICRVY